MKFENFGRSSPSLSPPLPAPPAPPSPPFPKLSGGWNICVLVRTDQQWHITDEVSLEYKTQDKLNFCSMLCLRWLAQESVYFVETNLNNFIV